jgi:type III restriction enzyme
MPGQIDLELEKVDLEQYRLIHTMRGDVRNFQVLQTEDLSSVRERQEFSELSLVAEISRYLNIPCLHVEVVLARTKNWNR